MRYGTIRLRKFAGSNAPRPAWRGWAGPVSPSIADSDLARCSTAATTPNADCGPRAGGAVAAGDHACHDRADTPPTCA